MVKERGPAVTYEAVPFEMIRTAHTAPQVLVSIDDLPAVCTGSCDYTYSAAQGLLTEMNVAGTVVSLKGQDLPIDDIVEIKLAHTLCAIMTNTTTDITCELVTPWVFGKWLPAVRTTHGFVPINESLQLHEVPSVLTSMTPTNVNPGGGEIMTVNGANFPTVLEDFPGLRLTWSDGTPCVLLTSTPYMVTCQNGRFSDAVLDEAVAQFNEENGQGSGDGRRDL